MAFWKCFHYVLLPSKFIFIQSVGSELGVKSVAAGW